LQGVLADDIKIVVFDFPFLVFEEFGHASSAQHVGRGDDRIGLQRGCDDADWEVAQ
jgi:hypothetical protein